MSKPPDSGAPLADWLQWLESRDPSRIELGLDRVRRVLRRLNLPPRDCPLVTVAGTNGKGSVVATLDALAGAAGLRVGAYLSPHLLQFNERIRICGLDVDDAILIDAFSQLAGAEQGDVLTYFEFTTLAAIVVLQHATLDLWVLEVGLGGRLDAVNVLDADAIVLTSIGLDHTDWLGDTLAEIAREKLGVLRRGIPLICGVEPDADPTVLSAIADASERMQAPLWQMGAKIRVGPLDANGQWSAHIDAQHYSGLPAPALAGAAQRGNAALAMTALQQIGIELTSRALNGLQTVRLPGRCQTVANRPLTLVDTAHNAEAARALAQTLGARLDSAGEQPSIHIVLGMLQGKPVAQFVEALQPLAQAWYFCSLPGPRGVSAQALAEQAVVAGSQYGSVAEGLAAARQTAGASACVVATGSFLTAEAVIKSLSMTGEATQ